MSGRNGPKNLYRVRLSWRPDEENPLRTHTIKTERGGEITVNPDSGEELNRDGSSPEELFLGSVSSGMMLTFLHLCKKNFLEVVAYQDDAVSVLSRGRDGRFNVEKIHLRPRVTFRKTDIPDWNAFAVSLFHEAHYYCFIVNSIKSSVDIEPLFVIEDI